MPNLIEELGAEYVTEMYNTALFLHEGVPHMFHRAGRVACLAYKGDPNLKGWKTVELPNDAFPDMGKFQWPMLGYRNIAYKKHNMVVEVSLARSAKRGLRSGLLHVEGTKAGQLFNNQVPWAHLLGAGPEHASLILTPKWYTMREAREALYSGTAVSCALNANLALEINPFVEDPQELSVLYRGAKVGAMRGDGTLEVPSRLAARIM